MAHTIVIFGASGDLTSRKLVPALYELYAQDRLPPSTRIIGVSRTVFSHDEFRAKLTESTSHFIGESFNAEIWNRFAANLFYQPGDIDNVEDFKNLRNTLHEIEGDEKPIRVYYLSTAPRFYEPAIAHLGQSGLASEFDLPHRIVIEKPFGTDLLTARALNEFVHKVFPEQQIYRIDHYLGKETVSNLLVLRFANTIFEPIWNRNYIDHVQITAAESVTVGRRAGYYESAGVLRDMLQNHLLQILTLTAMEAPVRFESKSVRDEKVKVLRAIKPMTSEEIVKNTLRGQYREYRDEPGVDPQSITPTFGVVKLCINNWRWKGVPFYLRTGKGFSCRTTQIVIQFRRPPFMMFGDAPESSHEANRLVLQIQPAEGIQLHFLSKVPDAGMKLRMSELDFSFGRKFAGPLPDSYLRLLLDVMYGDASLFARSDEVELAWGIMDPVQATWASPEMPGMEFYETGAWGPPYSSKWMEKQGRLWFDSCPVL